MSASIRVLYLDDSRTDRDLVRHALETVESGFAITEAHSRAAFEMQLRTRMHDVIVTDYHLPGFTALEVIDIAHAANEDLPVLIVTGTGNEELAVAAMKRGAADYLVKSPDGIESLPAAIRTALSRDRRSGERRQAAPANPDFEATFEQADDVTARKRAEQLLSLEHAVARILADANDTETALRAVLRVVCESHEWAFGRFWPADDAAGLLRAGAYWSVPSEAIDRYVERSAARTFAPGVGLLGRAWQTGRPVWIPDARLDSRNLQPDFATEAGLRGVILFPVRSKLGSLGVLAFASREIREPDAVLHEAAEAISGQLGQFLQRKQSEEKLRASEARFRSLTALSSDWYWEQDSALRFTNIGDSPLIASKLRTADYIGTLRWDHPTTLGESGWAAHRAVLEAREPFVDFEYGHRLPDGDTCWVRISGTPVFDADGAFKGYRGIGRNVTEARRAQKLLDLEHAVARCLNSASGTSEVLSEVIRSVCETQDWDYGRYWEPVSPRAALLCRAVWSAPATELASYVESSNSFAYQPGTGLVGLVWATGNPLWVADMELDDRVLQKGIVRSTGLHGSFVFPVIAQEETIGVLSFVSREVKEPDSRFLAAARMIGSQVGQYLERKRAEEALRRFRVALDNSADMILLVDRASMRYVDVNETACRLLGYSREELIGMHPQDVLPVSGPELEKSYDELIADPSIKGGLNSHYRCKDGTTLPFESARHVLRSGDGYLIAAISRDIRERQRAEAALRDSERFSKMTLDALTKHICVLDDRGTIIAVNRAWREFATANGGERQHVLEGVSYLEVCDRASASEAALVAHGVRSVIAGERARFDLEYPCHSASEQRWFHMRVTRFADDGPVRLVVAHDNVTASVLAAAKIQRHARQQKLIAAFGQMALAGTGPAELQDQVVLLASYGLGVDFCKFLQPGPDTDSLVVTSATGWEDDWIGSRIARAGAGTDMGYVLQKRQSVTVDDFDAESRFERSSMQATHGIASGIAVPVAGANDDGQVGVLGAFSRDRSAFSVEDVDFLQSLANTLESVAERRRAEEKLAHLSQFDTLTDLPNRSLLRDRLGQALTQAQRNSWLTAVLVVSMDRFKRVNDTLGHEAGDILLKVIGKRLAECVRSGDTVSRLGGDEFAIVLSNLAKADDASLVAQKVVAACARVFELGGKESRLSCSIGVALSPDDGSEPDMLLKNADIALHRAKEQGGNGYQYFLPEMHRRAVERVQTEADLRAAVARSEFVLHYQPKADLFSGKLSGFEALLRWQHPSRGLVPPLQFIPVLEDTGLIVTVGEWVVRTVCAQLMRWKADGLPPRPVAVNLSARQFQQKDLDSVIGSILQETGVDPGLLELELTESLLMKDADEAVRVLRNLKARGVQLSVDDFGTGYSSLAYLKRFPIDCLKIDRAFIRECTTDAEDATIALSIINLAHSLKLKVVAEGVETEAQLNFLRSRGCDQLQGYYFAKPMDAVGATDALARDIGLRFSATADTAEAIAVLLVDDNGDDLEIFRETLASDGYRILTARSPQLALETMSTEVVDIVISDQRMPSMSGVDFLAAVGKLHPEAIRVMLTGSDSPDALPEAVNEARIHKYLSKHWDEDRLRLEVRAACKLVLARRLSGG
jgi:diguanylate cyclase (GGDEF)-like protein/PAS domain S-box-containing protein